MELNDQLAPLIDARQLAERLGITQEQVHRLSSDGKIPKYKIGHRTVRFCLSEVLAALRQAPDPKLAVRSLSDDVDELVQNINLGEES